MSEQRTNPLSLEAMDKGANGAAAPAPSLTDRVKSLRLPDAPTSPAKTAWFPWICCGFFALLSGYLALFGAGPRSADKPEDKANPSPLTTTPSNNQTNGRIALEAGGYVIPERRVQVSPKVGGEVVELRIEEGKFVEKGELLARLDRTKFEFEYRRMEALRAQAEADYLKMKNGYRDEEIKQAEAALREAEELRAQIKDECERLRRARPASSIEELVKVESRLAQANFKCDQLRQNHKMMAEGYRKEDIERAKATFEHAQAQRDNAKYDLECCDVLSPVTGVILTKGTEVGSTVRPEAFSNGISASLCYMADLKALEVDVDVAERDLNRVFPGQKCEIRTEAFPDRVYSGVVSRLMPEANRSKASVSVRVSIHVPDGERLIRPEMRARVTFFNPEKEPR